ncbi:Membrane associated serine protease, rhomboid family [Bowdeniella nasicola]|uniref:Membrane associated serine protease, rhomboid family n=1 Tax=Bowdeniella nasicola TaxID=208480 RepID=A0A1H4BT91_9ACTO|nr:rhomboid family intramembrane serine protease [Bowdeniella nasicola]SEA51323.1 Membrane associated serine protease, rhomboid family [Bowdeniella nasicola]
MTASYGEHSPENQPTCPRHPDQVTYVSCQRCGRPTCAKCQVQAPVGVRCVDCAREFSKRAPVARTIGGAKVGRFTGTTTVTMWLIYLCVGMQVLAWIFSALPRALMFVPALGPDEPWRFITSAFVHGGLWHLALNMLALWMIGQGLEPVLGKVRYILLYLLSAFGGSVFVLLLASTTSMDWYTGAVGASGAIFGMFGALFVLNKKAKADMRAITILIAINLAYGFFVAGISWQAHLGGLITGAILAYGFITSAQRKWHWGAWATSAVVFVALVVAVIVKYSSVGLTLV